MDAKNQQISRAMMEKLLHLNQVKDATHDVYKILADVALKEIDYLTEEQKEEIFKTVISKIDTTGDMLNVYKKYYDVDDVLNLIAFYKSKTGQKFIKYNSKIISDIMGITLINTNFISGELIDEIKKRS